MNKKCINQSCEHEFEGNHKIYERCPICSAGTVPYIQPRLLEGYDDVFNYNERYGFLTDHKALISATKCPHAVDCYPYGHYKPSCEDLVFTLDCLSHVNTQVSGLQEEISSLHQKLDKILNLLEK